MYRYWEWAPRAKSPAAMLAELFDHPAEDWARAELFWVLLLKQKNCVARGRNPASNKVEKLAPDLIKSIWRKISLVQPPFSHKPLEIPEVARNHNLYPKVLLLPLNFSVLS